MPSWTQQIAEVLVVRQHQLQKLRAGVRRTYADFSRWRSAINGLCSSRATMRHRS